MQYHFAQGNFFLSSINSWNTTLMLTNRTGWHTLSEHHLTYSRWVSSLRSILKRVFLVFMANNSAVRFTPQRSRECKHGPCQVAYVRPAIGRMKFGANCCHVVPQMSPPNWTIVDTNTSSYLTINLLAGGTHETKNFYKVDFSEGVQYSTQPLIVMFTFNLSTFDIKCCVGHLISKCVFRTL